MPDSTLLTEPWIRSTIHTQVVPGIILFLLEGLMVRFKNRYLVFQIDFEDGLCDKEVKIPTLVNHIQQSIETHYGDRGAGGMSTSLTIKYFDYVTSIGIVRVSRTWYKALWSCLTLLLFIDKRRCRIRVLHVSGTVRGCQAFIIRHHRQKLRLQGKTHRPFIRPSMAISLGSPDR